MGYRIVYGKDPFEEKERKSHLQSLTAGFALALVILVKLCWPAGTESLRTALVPTEHDAVLQLQEDLKAGEPLYDALTAFCRMTVEEALAQTD